MLYILADRTHGTNSESISRLFLKRPHALKEKPLRAPGSDCNRQASAPVFYLICDKKSRRAAVCLFICLLAVHCGSVSVPIDGGRRLTRQLTRSESENTHRSKRPVTERHPNGNKFHPKMTFPVPLPAQKHIKDDCDNCWLF